MAVVLTTSATVPSGTEILATVYEDTSGDGNADNGQQANVPDGTTDIAYHGLAGSGSNYWIDLDMSTSSDGSTPTVDSASIDANPGTTSERLTASVTLNGETVDVQVYQDTSGDGVPDQSDVIRLPDGSSQTRFYSVVSDDTADHWVDVQPSTANDGTTPTVDSLAIERAEEFINAQAATVDVQGQNASLAAGPESITAQEATLSVAAQNAGIDPGAVSITATVGILDAAGQDAVVSPGKASIQADAGVLQITAEDAGRVFDSTTLSGTVTLNGSAVEGATIYCIDDTNQNVAEVTTTDQNGDYQVRVDTGDLYHMVVQYEDDQGNQYNDESKPFLAT